MCKFLWLITGRNTMSLWMEKIIIKNRNAVRHVQYSEGGISFSVVLFLIILNLKLKMALFSNLRDV